MIKLLIVDDSKVMRDMVAACLRPLEGAGFEFAASGLEAIERLSLSDFALVVLDLNMPDIGGIEVVEFVRSQDKLQEPADPHRHHARRRAESAAGAGGGRVALHDQAVCAGADPERRAGAASADGTMSDVIDLKQFLSGFLSETDELLRTANTNLLLLETSTAKGAPNARAVRELYRALHTIKGLAGMVGINPIVDLAHALETVLRAADRGSGRLSREAIELCLKGVKAIEDRVAAVAKQKEAPPAPARLLEALGRLEPVAVKESVAAGPLQLRPELKAKLAPAELQQIADGIAAGFHLFLIEFLPSTTRSEQGFTITTVRERVAQVGRSSRSCRAR